MRRTTLSERALVLAPRGRDAAIAAAMLAEAGLQAMVCAAVAALLAELDLGAAFVVVTEEAIADADLHGLSRWIAVQEEWSDLPFVLLTNRGGGIERNPAAARYLELLGNVTFLERPFHPTTLVSLARSALRARKKQYEARARLAALRESEGRYRTLFDTIDEGFGVIELIDGPGGPLTDYRHVQANPAFSRELGVGEVVGRTLREMMPAGGAERWIDLYRQVLTTGEPIRLDRELPATGRHLELAAFRVEPPERREVAVLFQDVTERRRAERALRASEARYRALFESLESGFCVFDVRADADTGRVDLRVVEANPAFAVHTGLADAQGQWLRTYTPRLGERWYDSFDRIVRTGVAERFEEGSEGLGRWFDAYAFRIDHPEHRRVAVLFHDVSARRSAEAQLRRLNETLETRIVTAIAEREDAQEALRQAQKMEAMGQLTGGVAHDFNNLLTPIVGGLDLLKRRGLGGERERRLIDGAAQSAERAKVLVQRLLAFARRQPLQPVPVDLAGLVAGMAELVASTTGPQIRVAVDTPAGMPPARVDPNQLEMALLNLAVNARDAMPGGGTLRIAARAGTVAAGEGDLAPGGYICLSVADTGVGMDEDTRARAIEPFYSTKGVGKGTGLGLSMAHGLASQLGGALRILSAPGEGTTVELWLPQTEADPAPPERAVREGETPAGRGTALLVDDEELVRLSTADMLADLGYRVIEAASAEEALALLDRGEAFDLLVTDHLMPGMTGADLARSARTARPWLPVLLVSGYAEGEGVDAALPRLTKPFRAGELAASLAQL